jgi:hypothetical protein
MSASINSWKDLVAHLILDRGMSGEQAFQPFVEAQNIKVACLEIFNQRNLDYENINQCVNKLHQAEDQLNETLSRFSKY